MPRQQWGIPSLASFGWGTSGTTTQWAGAKHSVLFAASGDGGTAQDYRAYLTELAPAVGAPISPTSEVYAAGNTTTPDSRNNTDPYYAGFGQVTAPAAQTTLFGTQTGATAPGTLGMAWHEVAIEKSGDNVSWFVDDLRIATVPITGANLGGENIFFGMFDINATSSTATNDFLNAAIYDNVRVETVPEPSAVGMLASGICLLLRRRRTLC